MPRLVVSSEKMLPKTAPFPECHTPQAASSPPPRRERPSVTPTFQDCGQTHPHSTQKTPGSAILSNNPNSPVFSSPFLGFSQSVQSGMEVARSTLRHWARIQAQPWNISPRNPQQYLPSHVSLAHLIGQPPTSRTPSEFPPIRAEGTADGRQ